MSKKLTYNQKNKYLKIKKYIHIVKDSFSDIGRSFLNHKSTIKAS